MKAIILFLVFFANIVFGQDLGNFKERHKIDLLGFSNNKFKFSPKDSTEYDEKINIVYDKYKNIISYNIIKKKKTETSKILDKAKLSQIGLINSRTKADLEIKGNKVFIYPFIYIGKDSANINTFFRKNNIYLELSERKNYSFRYRTWQLGAATIPVKWYMDSKLGNITTDINAMMAIGHKWGRTNVVKLPHEANARQYQRTFSVNYLLGITKIELDQSNTIAENPVEGNVAAISNALSFGIHYQDFTFLAAVGIDLPTSNRNSWEFTGVPWLGLGFGYNFIKFAGKSNE